jgi:hypothetical protein
LFPQAFSQVEVAGSAGATSLIGPYRKLAILCWALCNVCQAEAAEIQTSSTAGCAIELTGEILKGDFNKFTKMTETLRMSDGENDGELENAQVEALCLDSIGGSYIEGRRLALFVHDNAIATRVTKNSECFSACALIFMAGRVRGNESDYPARTLHVMGRLGFHAPYWRFDDSKTFTASEIENLTNLQNSITADFIRFGSFASLFSYRPDISVSLLTEMYSSGPDTLAVLDTVEKAARWGVDLEGFSSKAVLNARDAARLCLNFQNWSRDQTAIGLEKASDALDIYVESSRYESREFYGKKTEFIVIDTGGLAAQYCEIEVQKEASDYQQICVKDDFSGRHLGDCASGAGFWVPTYYSRPANTPIQSLR